MPVSHWSARVRPRPLTCLGDASEVSAGGRSEFARAVPRDYPWRKTARKWWEWDYIAHCAEALGLLRPDATALGLGVGVEPLMYYFATRCGRVVATDIYSDDSSWPDSNTAQARMYSLSPLEYPRDRLEFRSADMRATRQPDASCDLVWSTSSIEHVANWRGIVDTYREVHRILKPGGYAVLTTEFCLTEPPFLLENVSAHDPVFFEKVARQLGGLEVVGPVDLGYNWVHPGNAAGSLRYIPPDWTLTGLRGNLFDSGTGSGRPFAAFRAGACGRGGPVGTVCPQYRGGQMAFLLGMSVVAPVGLVLRKVGRSVRGWAEFDLPAEWRALVDAQHLAAGRAFREALDLARGLVGAGRSTPLQFRLHALALYARTLAPAGAPCDDEALRPVRDALDELAGVAVIDAESLQHCADLLAIRGDLRPAADLYWACMTSPSTNCALALKLGLGYVMCMRELGKLQPAADAFAVVVRDLLANGLMPWDVPFMLRQELDHAAARRALTAADVAAVRAAVLDELTYWGGEYAGMFAGVADAVREQAAAPARAA